MQQDFPFILFSLQMLQRNELKQRPPKGPTVLFQGVEDGFYLSLSLGSPSSIFLLMSPYLVTEVVKSQDRYLTNQTPA